MWPIARKLGLSASHGRVHVVDRVVENSHRVRPYRKCEHFEYAFQTFVQCLIVDYSSNDGWENRDDHVLFIYSLISNVIMKIHENVASLCSGVRASVT